MRNQSLSLPFQTVAKKKMEKVLLIIVTLFAVTEGKSHAHSLSSNNFVCILFFSLDQDSLFQGTCENMNEGTFICDFLEVPCWPAWCDDLIDCYDWADVKNCTPVTSRPLDRSKILRDWGRQNDIRSRSDTTAIKLDENTLRKCALCVCVCVYMCACLLCVSH